MLNDYVDQAGTNRPSMLRRPPMIACCARADKMPFNYSKSMNNLNYKSHRTYFCLRESDNNVRSRILHKIFLLIYGVTLCA